ncbi:phosphoribosylformylglycinamidine synthase subunit PurQ [Streptomyces thinghirensis]|nr:phosphoribosylformylglycinamidine synthase subunit PurQ [Streptomyces thinghirensis]
MSLWHKDKDLKQVDAVVLCGGFSYGDYLRAGAIARFSPVMDTVIDQAKAGLPVLGICNGFQILTEAHLLPGGMLGNDHLHFICRDQKLRVENADTSWTSDYADGQGDPHPAEEHGRPLRRRPAHAGRAGGRGPGRLRYLDMNPNGSLNDIAGITNAAGNVVGLMPHPEHAVEPLIGTGRTDGLPFFTSILKKLVNA